MASELERRYFDRVKNIWKAFEPAARAKGKYIIPFCTPIVMTPPALVIATNHSDFAPGLPSMADNIARKFSEEMATVNTYIVHDHNFARGMRDVCGIAGIDITEEWVGTNRCAVQWEPGDSKIKEIERIAPMAFAECQRAMDDTLRELVLEISPRNVILVGKYARRLFYQKERQGQTFDDFPPKWDPHAEGKTWVIPIEHPTYPNNRQKAARRLKEHFKR